MSSAPAVLERPQVKKETVLTSYYPENKTIDFNFLQQPQPIKEYYFEDSEIFQIKGGYTAELISNAKTKIEKSGLLPQIKNELGEVLLKAFEKGNTEADLFLSGSKFLKIAIWVDWLVVVRKRIIPVAFGSGTFITPFLFYLNGAMVMPEYQTVGLGYIANAILWKKAVELASQRGYQEPDIICRTHNRNVASALLDTFIAGKISTESNLDHYVQMLIQLTTKYLGCGIDESKGISHNVYPEGLPAGSKFEDARINRAFASVGPRDACYVTGKLNFKHVQWLLKRHSHLTVTPKKASEVIGSYQEPMMACA